MAAFALRLAREATGNLKATYKKRVGSRSALMEDEKFVAAFGAAKARIRKPILRFVEERSVASGIIGDICRGGVEHSVQRLRQPLGHPIYFYHQAVWRRWMQTWAGRTVLQLTLLGVLGVPCGECLSISPPHLLASTYRKSNTAQTYACKKNRWAP